MIETDEQGGLMQTQLASARRPQGRRPKRSLTAQVRYGIAECSLGTILLARSDRGVFAIFLGDHPADLMADLKQLCSEAEQLQRDDNGLSEDLKKIRSMIEAPEIHLSLPVELRGTDFQKRVWTALRAIPFGETRSYSEIAANMGMPSAARAVAAACAANPLALLVPCHRVVRRDGNPSGYRWATERKTALLQRERRALGRE